MPQNLEQIQKCHVIDNLAKGLKNMAQRSVCQNLSANYEHNNNHYCILHYPDDLKHENTDFTKIVHTRIENAQYDFSYVYFSEIFLLQLGFGKKEINSSVKFNNATFKDYADFSDLEFNDWVDFTGAKFFKDAIFAFSKFKESATFIFAEFREEVNFNGCYFGSGANFSAVEFNNIVSFWGTTFEADKRTFFRDAKFRDKAIFQDSIIKGELIFEGNDKISVFLGESVQLDLQKAIVNKYAKVVFQSVYLCPSWFINIDSRNFVFTDVIWNVDKSISTKSNTTGELQKLEKRVVNSKALLKITCRQLAENAENNNRFEDASKFRQMAFETEWLEKKEKISNWFKNLIPESEKLKRRFSGSTNEEDKPNPPTNSFGILRRSGDFIIHWLYRITSFYGESWERAFIWFVLICPVFALLLYLFGSFDKDSLQTAEDFLAYSLQVMTLQKPEPKPVGFWTVLIYSIEIVFTPIQLALLALAIRRKFMR